MSFNKVYYRIIILAKYVFSKLGVQKKPTIKLTILSQFCFNY